jgi:hypothetical protein
MLDCKAISTPMVDNLKLMFDTTSDIVDSTTYKQMIGSLMYLMNNILDICSALNTLSQFT